VWGEIRKKSPQKNQVPRILGESLGKKVAFESGRRNEKVHPEGPEGEGVFGTGFRSCITCRETKEGGLLAEGNGRFNQRRAFGTWAPEE